MELVWDMGSGLGKELVRESELELGLVSGQELGLVSGQELEQGSELEPRKHCYDQNHNPRPHLHNTEEL